MSSGENFAVATFTALVDSARESLEAAPPPHEDRRMRWANSDFYSFDAAMELEDFVAAGKTHSLPVAGWTVADSLTDWRKALPFSDGERTRLLEVKRAYPAESRLASIVRQEVSYEAVEDEGITTRVSGKHLMQTWWQWRRGVGERFEGQSGRERAIRSLWLARQIIEN